MSETHLVDDSRETRRAELRNLIRLGTTATAGGRLGDAIDLLTEALDGLGTDGALRPELSTAFRKLAWALWSRRHPRAFEAMRIACALDPDAWNVRTDFDHLLMFYGAPARLVDFMDGIGEEDLGTHVFIACFPKSGSTLLKSLLAAVTGFANTGLTYAYLQNEQELYLPYLRRAAAINTITQQHCRATVPNLHLMQGFGIRPVILVRDIFDVLLSWKEFLDDGAVSNTFYPRYFDLNEHRRLDLVVDDRAPWYLSFFAGWQRAVREGQVEGMWLTYEDLVADKCAAVEAVLRFYGLEADAGAIERAVANVPQSGVQTRLNKGVSGRGAVAFDAAQKERVRRLAAYHPDVDFSAIGL